MKKIYLIFTIVFLGVMYSCSYNEYVDFPVEEPIDSVLFKTTIEPMFQSGDIGCTSCHPTTMGLDLTTGNAYANIINGQIDNDSAENSKIYYKPYPNDHHGKKYTSQQALYILTWIKEGAHDN